MPFTTLDTRMMQHALVLAERGAYTTKPNPMVGCVIARGDKIVGEGFHQRAGEAHAEVFALQQAGELARGATAYVTLEPCAHFGKTPPCADALVSAGITRVVAAVPDPYHAVSGRGFEKLQAAGIHVEQGLLETQARELNRGFLSRVQRGRPWVRVKMAMSLDGRTAMANGESKWISSDASRDDVAKWRARSSAILTSAATVEFDDPQLTVRLAQCVPFVPPLRTVIDTGGLLRDHYRIFDNQAESLSICSASVVPVYSDHREAMSLPEKHGHVDLAAVLSQLTMRGVNEFQVEAGANLSGAFLKQQLVDELLIYIAPIVLGEKSRPLFSQLNIYSMAQRMSFTVVDNQMLDGDIRLLLRNEV